MKTKLLSKLMLLLTMMFVGVGTASAADKWVETDITSLSTGDIIVIVDKTSSRAMSNNNGTSKAPSAVSVTLNTEKTEITSAIESTLQWKFIHAGTDAYKFQANVDDEKYLYAINNNNCLRVGSGAHMTFNIKSGYLYNTDEGRYMGVYNNNDWRGYTTIHNNISATVVAFYKHVADASGKTNIATINGLTPTTINTGTTGTFTLDATYAQGASYSVTWESDDEDVLLVEDGEYIAGSAAGTANVTVTITPNDTENYEEVSETFAVQVKAPTNTNPFVKVTSIDDISAGIEYVLVYESGEKAMGAIGTLGTYGASVSISISNNEIEDVSSLNVLTLEKVGDNWAFKTSIEDKYLSWSSGNSLDVADDNTSAAAQWTIEYDENGVLEITSYNDATRKLQYNTGNPRFACYLGTQQRVALYRKSVSITPSAVATPTFSVAEGEYFAAQSVEISCATSGATIYYTTDGTEPTAQGTQYTAPLSISTTTTLKAIAIKDNESSSVATATYTFPTIYANLAALVTAGEAGYVQLTNAIVTYKNGTSAYIEDTSAGMYLFKCAGNLAIGDKITGVINVTGYQVYNGLPEITAFTLIDGYTKTEGNTVTPTEVTIAQLTSNPTNYLSRYVKITNATVTSAFSGKNATISQNGSSITLRDQNSQATLVVTVGSTVDVVGHGSIYSGSAQLALWEQSQITVKAAVKVDPEVSFAHETVFVKEDRSYFNEITAPADLTFTYSSSDENVAIVASDGTVTGVAAGTAEITVSWAATTLYYAGTATYTVEVVTTMPTFELVTDASMLKAGDEIMIAYVDVENEICMALSTTQNPNNRKATTDVELIEYSTLEAGFDVQIITLEKAGNNFLFNVGDGYLYAASSSSNWLRTEDEADDNAKAAITIENDTATIVFQGENTRNHLRYNTNVQNGVSNPMFSCYEKASSHHFAPMIYRKVASSGDVNGDGEVNLEDVEVLASLMVYGDTDSSCDIDGDGEVTLKDITKLVNIINGIGE